MNNLWPYHFESNRHSPRRNSWNDKMMKNKRTWVIAICLILFAVLLARLVSSTGKVPASELPDGTRYTLVMVAYTNSYQYARQFTPDWVRPFTPLIPDRLERKLFGFSGTIGLGNTAETNLMVVIEAANQHGEATQPVWLRIRDNEGNGFDGNSTRGILSSGGNESSVYLVSVTPNRSRNLFVEPLVLLDDGMWTNVGPFAVANPKFKEYPQWTPEPIPQSRTDGTVAAALVQFESGPGSAAATSKAPPSAASPRSTSMAFDFTEDNEQAKHFRIHKITLSDATGNRWSPFLDPLRSSRSRWVKDGAAEFGGGLWPSEDAWRIELQAIRTAGFDPESIWQVPPIAMPGANSFNDLTNEFTLGKTTIQIANILAPDVQVTSRWQWHVRYWGDEKSVHPIGMECKDLQNRRPIILEARNESGADFKIISHQNVDHEMQSIFLQPPVEGARELHLKIAFPPLKKFEFFARPEFVE